MPPVTGYATPTNLISINGNGFVLFDGVQIDPAGNNFIKDIAALTFTATYVLKNCYMDTSISTLIGGTGVSAAIDIICIGNDDGQGLPTNYKYDRTTRGGRMTTDTTFVRTGGASMDSNGYSWKIVTPAAATPPRLFETIPITVYNDIAIDGATSLEIAVEGCWASGTRPTNAEVYMEASGMDSAGSIETVYSTTPIAKKETPFTWPTSTATWSGSPGSKFKMTINIFPVMAGPITVVVKVPKNSTTVYIDPKVVLSV